MAEVIELVAAETLKVSVLVADLDFRQSEGEAYREIVFQRGFRYLWKGDKGAGGSNAAVPRI